MLDMLASVQSAFSYEGRPFIQDLILQGGRFVEEHIVIIVAVVVGAAVLLMYLRD
jgi:hypothetical protein